MPPKLSQDEAIKRLEEFGKDRFEYNLVVYNKTTNKIKIKCIKHQLYFEQMYRDHFRGKDGCPKCKSDAIKNRLTRTTEQFIKECKEKLQDDLDYSKVLYINTHTPVVVICPKHGEFSITPTSLLMNKGKHSCKKCAFNLVSMGNKEFIRRAKSKHGDKYTYNKSEYVNQTTKVIVTCKEHGDFKVRPGNHIDKGNGCPKCKSSKGEIAIRLYLEDNKIKFEQEKRFKTCKSKRCLPFDFYLPDLDILIEMHGQQHFFPIEIFGGEKALKSNLIRDKIKQDWADKNNFELLIIKYDENIQECLSSRLGMK